MLRRFNLKPCTYSSGLVRITTPVLSIRHNKLTQLKRCVLSKSTWDESVALADLRGQLEAALKQEDYRTAAKLRDVLQ